MSTKTKKKISAMPVFVSAGLCVGGVLAAAMYGSQATKRSAILEAKVATFFAPRFEPDDVETLRLATFAVWLRAWGLHGEALRATVEEFLGPAGHVYRFTVRDVEDCGRRYWKGPAAPTPLGAAVAALTSLQDKYSDDAQRALEDPDAAFWSGVQSHG